MPTTRLVRAIEPGALARAADIIKLLGHAERLKIVELRNRDVRADLSAAIIGG